jgi:hypothetical protein
MPDVDRAHERARGGCSEAGLVIAVNGSGQAYVTGLTESPADFALNALLQPAFDGGTHDARLL